MCCFSEEVSPLVNKKREFYKKKCSINYVYVVKWKRQKN